MRYTILFSLLLAMSSITHAQRGDIVIPTGAAISVPAGAQLCADRIYANNPGYGPLTLANASCLCAGAAVVPVELLSFSAALDNGIVYLRWITATETNCAGFEVQRATERLGWQSIGYIRGHGTTNVQSVYHHADPLRELAAAGVLHYRLKAIDYDGGYEYSPIVEILLDEKPPIPTLHELYPNPAKECVTLRFALPEEMDVSITVYSISGATVRRNGSAC
jgi:hypothetical protein